MLFRYGFVRVAEIDPTTGKAVSMVVNVSPESVEPADDEARALSPQQLAEMRIKIARQAEAEVRARES
jgi:hypothetical protein